jgi:hypothetical protein
MSNYSIYWDIWRQMCSPMLYALPITSRFAEEHIGSMRIGPCCEKQHRLWELFDFVIVKVGER